MVLECSVLENDEILLYVDRPNQTKPASKSVEFYSACSRSIMWFPILQWRNKTFCKFWYFDSGKGLKLLVIIIVTGNNKWFTSFCFLSWFRKNEMWRNKTFIQNIESWRRDDGLLQPMMCPNTYCTVLNHFQSQKLL